MKRLKNIEDKNKEQLKITRNKTGIRSQIHFIDEDLAPEGIPFIKEIKSIEENVGYDKLSFRGGNIKIYYFYKFETLEQLIKDLLNRNLTIDEAERKQNEFDEKLDILRFYPTRRSEYIDLKESVSKNAKKKLWRMGKNCLWV